MARFFLPQVQPIATVSAYWHDYDTIQVEWFFDKPYYNTFYVYKFNIQQQTGVFLGKTTGLTVLVTQSADYDYLQPNEGDQYYIEYYDTRGWHRSNITQPIGKRPNYPFIIILPIILDG